MPHLTPTASRIFHYAPAQYLPRILNSGHLKPSNALARNRVPVLWFSSNQSWEHTATKMVLGDGGEYCQLTFEQHLEHLGCIRFGLDAGDARLMPWGMAIGPSGADREHIRALEYVGIMQGASPAEWFGVFTPVELAEVTCEVYTSEAGWLPLPLEELTPRARKTDWRTQKRAD